MSIFNLTKEEKDVLEAAQHVYSIEEDWYMYEAPIILEELPYILLGISTIKFQPQLPSWEQYKNIFRVLKNSLEDMVISKQINTS